MRSPQQYSIRSKKSYKKYLSDLKSVVTLLWGLVCLFALERVLLELSYQRFCLKSVGEGLMYDSLQSDQIQQFVKKTTIEMLYHLMREKWIIKVWLGWYMECDWI